MRAYSADLRQRVVDAYEQGEGSQRQLAERFQVSLDFVTRLLKQYQETQSIAPKRYRGGFAPKLAEHLAAVQQLVDADNDATLEELRVQVQRTTGVEVSVPTLCRTLQGLELTRKKNAARQSSDNRTGSNSAT
jgi:transposase